MRVSARSNTGVPAILLKNAPGGATLTDNGDGTRTFRWDSAGKVAGSYPVTFEARHPTDTTQIIARSFTIQLAATSVAAVAASSDAQTPVFSPPPSGFRGPVVQPLADQFVDAGGAVIFRVTPIDPDGTLATLLVNPLPAGATFDDNRDGTRTFFWQTSQSDIGTHRITFTAIDEADASLQHSESLLITVGELGSSIASAAGVDATTVDSTTPPLPQVNVLAIQPMSQQQVVIYRELRQVVRPIFPQGRAVPALIITNPPPGSSFDDNGDGTRTFVWKPGDGAVGTHRFDFEVVDSGDSSMRTRATLVVQVDAESTSAVGSTVSDVVGGGEGSFQGATTNTNVIDLSPIPEQFGRPNQELKFNVISVHPGRGVPSLLLRNEPRGAALYDNGDGSRLFAWTPNNEQTGIFTFDIVAIDASDPSLTVVRPVRLVINNDTPTSTAVVEPVVDPGVAPVVPESRADAARFLARASFGVRAEDLLTLRAKPYEQWINDQFGIPVTSHLEKLDGYLWDRGLFDISTGDRQLERSQLRSDAFWYVVVNAKDQLRQRVAYALSQILVISDREPALENRVRGFARYHDMLLEHAFGNYRNLLTDVALNPMMGDFLSSRRNEKANPAENIEPDENFARELMQLFTIGLDQLENNGSRRLDSNGQRLLAYSQDDVMSFARVFTGWNYGDSNQMRDDRRTLESEILPMKAYEEFHDKDPKRLLNGVTISGGRSARDDLDLALDNLFQHPNVPPFISRQLIQRLVTSNPSPAYIDRVANVFRNNGSGTRGDLASVVKAILLDPEALNGHRIDPKQFGKLKEPVIKIASIWRAFSARGRYNRFRYSDPNSDFAQQPYSAPSVFNFYSPDYRPPGAVGESGLYSPEAQLVNESTAIRGNNRLFDYAFEVPLGNDEIYANQHQIFLDLSAMLPLARQPADLVDELNELLMAGQMSEHMKDVLIRLAGRTPLNDNGSNRVREVIHMLFISPEFSVQR